MQQDSAKLGRDLSAYMREHHHSQAHVAEEAGVNQATVSRFLKKPPQRATVPNRKLCTYAERVLSGEGASEDKIAAQKALEECWNRSDAHARAVSKILNAMVELCRRDRDEEVASG
jgi:predicted transcriptional regulator